MHKRHTATDPLKDVPSWARWSRPSCHLPNPSGSPSVSISCVVLPGHPRCPAGRKAWGRLVPEQWRSGWGHSVLFPRGGTWPQHSPWFWSHLGKTQDPGPPEPLRKVGRMLGKVFQERGSPPRRINSSGFFWNIYLNTHCIIFFNQSLFFGEKVLKYFMQPSFRLCIRVQMVFVAGIYSGFHAAIGGLLLVR